MAGRVLMIAVTMVLIPVLAGATPPEIVQLENWAARIRPKASEVKWQQIPWQTDLVAAIAAAREERRPILVWASGDEPLERC